jgi:hypothetical protein
MIPCEHHQEGPQALSDARNAFNPGGGIHGNVRES